MAAVYYLLRTVVKPVGAVDKNALIAHLIWAVFFFTYTQNALSSGSKSIVNNRGLILNASFPRALLPLVAIVESIFDFVPTLLVYFVFQAVLGQPFGAALIMLPVVVVILTIFNMGLALLFAPLMVFFRDTGGFLPYINRVWLYVTPALYFISEIPPKLLAYLRWNPLYPFYAPPGRSSTRWPSPAYLARRWALCSSSAAPLPSSPGARLCRTTLISPAIKVEALDRLRRRRARGGDCWLTGS
jgi:ABC-type polysaccharide/polyol phosphate export permease